MRWVTAMQAVGKLQALDRSFTVIPDPKSVKSKKGVTFYVNSVPREMDMNLHDILGLARETGCITLEQLASTPTWTRRRAELALESMIKDGTCLIDNGAPDGVRLFWFPSSATGVEV
jgi:ESCRT-II complex subunit VPS22